MSHENRVRPQTRCSHCYGTGRVFASYFRVDPCPRCLGKKAVTYPRAGDLVVFWRNGRVKPWEAVQWDVEAAPEGEDWKAMVMVRSRKSGRRREAQAFLLYVVREAEGRVADELMGAAR
ncbi:MAG TPA: hypothetical protein VMZ50_08440 [Phycisphaerae bacterium]|nr:hypothetical protein [Phycisphaerae bacterium]